MFIVVVRMASVSCELRKHDLAPLENASSGTTSASRQSMATSWTNGRCSVLHLFVLINKCTTVLCFIVLYTCYIVYTSQEKKFRTFLAYRHLNNILDIL